MLAASVDAFKWLFMEKAGEMMGIRDLLHHLHGELVVVHSHVGSVKDRGQFVLCRSHFIVLGLDRNAQFPELFIEIVHIRGYLWFQYAKIVIFHLLTFRGRGAKKGAATEEQVFSLLIEIFIHKKILLLGSDSRIDFFDALITKKVKDFQRLSIERFHRTKKRRLFIQRLSTIGAECCWYIQRAIFDERRRRWVPGGVAASLKGRPQSSGWETGSVWLSLDELLSGEFHNDLAVS